MNNKEQQTITLHLDNIHDLFTMPQGDPFSEKVRFIPGIDFIKNEINPRMLHKKQPVHLIIYLPPDQIEAGIEENTRAALQRYCDFKVQQLKNVLSATTRDALQALLAGIIFLILGLIMLNYVTILPEFLRTLISDGFDIAFWVILWRPVDFFLFDRAAYWREYQRYKRITEMDIVVRKEL